MSTAALPQNEMTVEELAARVGAVPLWRVRPDPPPGMATEDDVQRIRREESLLCELVDGVLVEKAVSNITSYVAVRIIVLLDSFVLPRCLGWVNGADGFVRLSNTQLRAPDVSFFRREQIPGRRLPETGYVDMAPALAVEVFSPGNTLREMEQKRDIFFAAGTEQFWIVFPDRQEVEVWTTPRTQRLLGRDDLLEGGDLLPGFSVKVAELFVNVDLTET